MNLKIILIFLLTILMPTFFLSYFGFLAVRSEKSIVEKNMQQKYRAMADVVEGEIKAALSQAPEELLSDIKFWETIFLAQADLFKDEVFIFDKQSSVLSRISTRVEGQVFRILEDASFSRAMKNLPYTIAVYERHPMVLEVLKQKKDGLVWYISIIVFSAISILVGGSCTLWALSWEWRVAKMKSEFVAQLSHDLRRPLTSIRMFSEMLKEGRIPSEEKKQEYHEIIYRESDKLTHLANNILDFSRIESGRMRYAFKMVDIELLVKETVERFRMYLKGGKRKVIFNVSNQEGIANDDQMLCKIDGEAIEQVIMNLLSNADNYSSEDKEIHVNLIKGQKNIVVEVVDQGQGISVWERKKIFQKFYRMEHKTETQLEGSGLGLALVKHIVDAHQGKIKIESEKGKGTKFLVVLPI